MDTKGTNPKADASAFDAIAEAFDDWFEKNSNVFESELLATRHFISDPENTISVGCGTGLFEERLGIRRGCEPAEGMARLARKRGIEVAIGPAENVPFGDESADCVLLNTVLSYVKDRPKAMSEAFRVLKRGGRIVLSNLPKESSYAMLYDLAAIKGKYDPETAPAHPYPIQFIEEGTWVSTAEVVGLMKNAGFVDLRFAQTLTRHPKFSNDSVEEPVPGYDKGDYVVVRGTKP